MGSIKLVLKHLLRLFLITTLMSFPVFASQNVINYVLISKAKNSSTYELNINSTSPIRYKSVVQSNNKIYFDLKDSILSPDAGTIYDDVKGIDSVTVKQLDNNKVRIYVQGQNAKNTKVVSKKSVLEEAQEVMEVPVVKSVKVSEDTKEHSSNKARNIGLFLLAFFLLRKVLRRISKAMAVVRNLNRTKAQLKSPDIATVKNKIAMSHYHKMRRSLGIQPRSYLGVTQVRRQSAFKRFEEQESRYIRRRA